MVSRCPGSHRSYIKNRAEQRTNHSILRLSEAGPWAKPTPPYPTTIGKYIYIYSIACTTKPAREPVSGYIYIGARVEQSRHVHESHFWGLFLVPTPYLRTRFLLDQVIFLKVHYDIYFFDFEVHLSDIFATSQQFPLNIRSCLFQN